MSSSSRSTSVHRIPVEECSLAVEVSGAGPAVLLIHGFPLDRHLWRHQLDHLDLRCIAPDLRGMGDSDAPASGYTMARYAHDLAAVLDALGEQRVVVCGLSMGGYIAFEFARRFRDRIRSLILVDTKAEAESEEGQRGREAMIQRVEAEGVGPIVEELLPKLVAPSTMTRRPEVVRVVRHMMLGTAPAGFIGALAAMRDRPDSSPTLPDLAGIPTLVIVGQEDTITPPAVARLMAARIPGARLDVVSDAGHLVPLEQPHHTTQLLQAFLRPAES